MEWIDFVKDAAAVPEKMSRPATQAPIRADNPAAPMRVGRSSGALSTHWDLNYKQPEKKYKDADPRWTAAEKAAWRKEIAIMKARDQRFLALKNKYKGAPIPIEEVRRAYNGK